MTLRRIGDAILTTVMVAGIVTVLVFSMFIAYMGGPR